MVGGDDAGGKRCEVQYVLMVELTGLADGLDRSCERERRNKYDLWVLGLRNSENRRVITEKEDCEISSLDHSYLLNIQVGNGDGTSEQK